MLILVLFFWRYHIIGPTKTYSGVLKSEIVNHSKTGPFGNRPNVNHVGIQLSDMSGNRMAISSPVTEWFVIQVTIQLPD